jgi:beta-glucosidase
MKKVFRTVVSAFCLSILLSSGVMGIDNSPQSMPFMDTTLSIQERVDDLVSRMTLEEKVSQMQNFAPAIPRLGIPAYNWWSECLHGVANAGVATVFPQSIGLGATWNTDLMFKVATAISDEARAKHHEFVRRGDRGIFKGLTFWSPNVNIFRDPRWGRGQETYGEDPYLTGRMGVAFVKGLQGDDSKYIKVVSTPKHYAVHSGPEPKRHRFNAVVSERDERETFLPAFKACVTEGGAWSVMGAYNRTNGEACCAHRVLLRQILRKEWGFKGYVTSDCGAIGDIRRGHHLVQTEAEASALAVKIGCDLDCGFEYWALLEAVRQGLISEKEIDVAVKRLFEVRFRLGMFDPPEMVEYARIPFSVNDCLANRKLALQAAQESIVLLKNEKGILPLKKSLKSILVVGPNANAVYVLYGNYNGISSKPITPLEGIRNKVSQETQVRFIQGCGWTEAQPSVPIPESALRHSDPSGGSGLVGEYFNNMELGGPPVLTRIDKIVDFSWDQSSPDPAVKADTFSVRWTGKLVPPKSGTYTLVVTGDDGYRFFIDGKKIIENWNEHASQTRRARIRLRADREYDVRLEYYEQWIDADIQLSWTPPESDAVKEAVDAAHVSDVVIMVGGISSLLEGEEMSVDAPGFKGGDRIDIGLPQVQEDLLKAVEACGKPVVLVLLSGSALAVNWAQEHVPAILEAWYPGEEGGNAIADVLFGDYNPSGRLPVTFYKSADQLPLFEDYSMADRTYRYFKGNPLYPFGYGLSYTTFAYSNLSVPNPKVKPIQPVLVSVEVQNTGNLSGDEVVQLYLHDKEASTPRPIKALKGFRRISLAPGEKKTVQFMLTAEDLSMVDAEGKWVVEPGQFELLVGASSGDIRLKSTFEVVK